MATYEEMIAKARELAAEGRIDDARRLGQMALAARQSAQPAPAPVAAAQDPMLPSGDTDARSTQEFLQETGAAPAPSALSGIGETIGETAGAAGAGVARGAMELAGLPGTLGQLIDTAYERFGIIPEGSQEQLGAVMNPVTGESLRGLASGATGGATEFKGESIPARIAGTAGEFIGGGAGARLGAIAGTGSELAGMATEGTAAEPYARFAGAIAAPIGVAAAQRGLQNVVSPMAGQIEPARQAAVDTLRAAGVQPTAGQVVGGRAAQSQLYREAATPQGRQLAENALEDFTAAALQTVGATGRRATPEVLEEATKRIGSVFDDVVRGVDVMPEPANISRINQAVDTFREMAPKETAAPIFQNVQRALVRAFDKGETIPAATVSSWRSTLSKLTTSNDTATREAAREALEAVDDVINTSLTSAGRPEAVQQLSQARNQYRNLLAIERAAQRSEGGVLSPAQLRTALLQQGRRRYVQGGGDLGPLTRAGNEILSPLPQSGTAPRTMASQLTSGAPAGTGAGLGAMGLGADPLLATGIGLAATAAPALRNQFLSSGPGQRYMLNQMMSQGGPLSSVSNVSRTTPGIMAQ